MNIQNIYVNVILLQLLNDQEIFKRHNITVCKSYTFAIYNAEQYYLTQCHFLSL